MPQKVFIMGGGVLARRLFVKLFEDSYGDTIVGIGDVYGQFADAPTMAKQFYYNLKYDTIYGRSFSKNHSLNYSDNDSYIVVDGMKIDFYVETNPIDIIFGNLGGPVVIDCSGVADDGTLWNAAYLGGATSIIVTTRPDSTTLQNYYNNKIVVPPINDTPHGIACCIPNGDVIAMSVISKIVNDNTTLNYVYATVQKANTNFGYVQDFPDGSASNDARAADNIIYKGFSNAPVGYVIPELQGKVVPCISRVNNKNANTIFFNFLAQQSQTKSSVEIMFKSATGDISKYIDCNYDSIASSDYSDVKSIGVMINHDYLSVQNQNFQLNVHYDFICLHVRAITDYLYNHNGDFGF